MLVSSDVLLVLAVIIAKAPLYFQEHRKFHFNSKLGANSVSTPTKPKQTNTQVLESINNMKSAYGEAGIRRPEI